MRFVRTGSYVDRAIETYYNPIIGRVFERRDDGKTWIKYIDHLEEELSTEVAKSFEDCRNDIMLGHQMDDSRMNCEAASYILQDIVKDVVPIIRSYLQACFPMRLEPMTAANLMTWSPQCDFTNIHKPEEVDCGLNRNCGWYLYDGLDFSVGLHIPTGRLRRARGVGWMYGARHQLITACIESIIEEQN